MVIPLQLCVRDSEGQREGGGEVRKKREENCEKVDRKMWRKNNTKEMEVKKEETSERVIIRKKKEE